MSEQQRPGLEEIMAGEAVQVIQQKATNAQQNAAELAGRVGYSETDPPYVTDPEAPPETMTHQQIWDSVQAIDQAALSSLVAAWAKISTAVSIVFQLQRLGLHRALTGRWEGEGADAAMAAVERFRQAGEDIGEVAQAVGYRLDSMYYAAVATVASVPPVPVAAAADPDNPGESVLPGLTSGDKSRSDDQAVIAARNQAVAAIRNIYLPVFPPAGDGVPTFIPPPQLAGDSAGTPSQSGAPGTGPSSPENAPTNPAPGSPASTDPKEPAATDPSAAGSPPIAATNPSSTGPKPDLGSLVSGNPSNPSGPAPTAPGPGAPHPGGAPARPGPPAGPHQLGAGPAVPGRPGTNQPGAPGAVTPAASAAGPSARSTAAGRPMSPMMPGPLGGRRNEDSERDRSVPDYLIRQQEELEYIPPSAAGVIAEDHIAAQPAAAAPEATGPESDTGWHAVDIALDGHSTSAGVPAARPDTDTAVGSSFGPPAVTETAAPIPDQRSPSVPTAETSGPPVGNETWPDVPESDERPATQTFTLPGPMDDDLFPRVERPETER